MKKWIQYTDRALQKITPDPLVIAIGLTYLAAVLSLWLTPKTSGEILTIWGNGFWRLTSFTLQMAMILLGGFIVATSPPVKYLLQHLARRVHHPQQAVIVVVIVSSLASWLNWGFGLVVGAILATELAKSGKKFPFRLMIAAAYSSFILWHGGLSGSIPLLLNTPGNFSESIAGGVISLSQTTFSTFNIALTCCVFFGLLFTNWLLFHLTNAENLMVEASLKPENSPLNTSATKLELNPWLPWITGVFGLGFIVQQFLVESFRLDLNTINFMLIFIGLIAHGPLKSFLRSVQDGAEKVGPILIQYPFYAGIMALLTESGLATMISQFFVDIASAKTFPLLTFLSAGLVNIFVPSGGGQWVIQGPIVLPAAFDLQADLTKSIMAVAWGDAWTNLLQPFWALPLLAIAGLKIKDIMGFGLINLVVSGLIISSFLLFW